MKCVLKVLFFITFRDILRFTNCPVGIEMFFHDVKFSWPSASDAVVKRCLCASVGRRQALGCIEGLER